MRRNAALFVLISVLCGFGSTAMTLAARIWVLDLTGSVSLAALTGLCLYGPTFVFPTRECSALRGPKSTRRKEPWGVVACRALRAGRQRS